MRSGSFYLSTRQAGELEPQSGRRRSVCRSDEFAATSLSPHPFALSDPSERPLLLWCVSASGRGSSRDGRVPCSPGSSAVYGFASSATPGRESVIKRLRRSLLSCENDRISRAPPQIQNSTLPAIATTLPAEEARRAARVGTHGTLLPRRTAPDDNRMQCRSALTCFSSTAR